MGYNNRFRIVIFLVILFCASLIRPVYAYLDPGTGSFLANVACRFGLHFFPQEILYFCRIKNIL